MFGKAVRQTAVGLVLLGFCLYIIKLSLDGDINLYIHPLYNLFSVVMSSLAVFILLFGLVSRSRSSHEHSADAPPKSSPTVTVLVYTVLVLAFALPAQTLSSTTVEHRTLKTPGMVEDYGIATCSDESKPTSLEQWVYEISQYPPSCYEGKTIKLTGFVYESVLDLLPSDMFYLGRIVMSCCAIDAQPYALPIQKRTGDHYERDTWWTVTGRLEKQKVNSIERLVIVPQATTQIATPDNPYEYINLSANTTPALQ